MTNGSFIVRPAFPANPHAKVEFVPTAKQYGLFFRWTEEYGSAGPVGLTLLSVNQLGARGSHHAASAVMTGLARETGIPAEDRAALELLARFLFHEAQNQGVTIARDLVPSGCRPAAARINIEPAVAPTSKRPDPFAKFRVQHGPQQEGSLATGTGHRPCRRESCAASRFN